METVRVVVTAEHQYYGRRYAVDQEYDCEKQLVEPFQQQGWVRPVAGVRASAQSYKTRVMTATKKAIAKVLE